MSDLPHCPLNADMQCLPGPASDGLCCKVTPTTRPLGFIVIRRNPHHWDVATQGGRAFRIRGEPGCVLVGDERVDERGQQAEPGWKPFRSVAAAMAWCADELMHEREASS